MPESVIRSEEDVWQLLHRIEVGKLEPGLVFVIEGWNPEILCVPDDQVSQSLKPSTAKALSDFHLALSRAYAYLLHGQPNARLLTNEEKEALDLIFLIKPGSNIYEVLDDAVNKLVEELVTKMTGEQITFLLIILILEFFGQTLTRDWFRRRFEEKRHKLDVEERISLSERETERLRMMAKLCHGRKDIQPIERAATQAREALTRVGTTEKRTRILGTEINGKQAKAVLSQDRKRGAGKRLDGVYDVVEIGTENPEGYIGRLRERDAKNEFDVEINFDDLTEEDITALFSAVREKRSVNLHVNAWSVGDRIDRAIIMRAESLTDAGDMED